MGVNKLRHEVATDMATGESTSVAFREPTHEEYEAYRNLRQDRSLELPPQPPEKMGKGLAKGIGNLPSDIANLASEGIKNQLGVNNYAKFLDYQAMSAYEAGNIAQANSMANQANSIREFGSVGDIFKIENDAQKGGAFSSIFIPLGTLVKAGAGASKIVKAEKALDTASNTTRTANIASDTAKTGEAANASKTTDAPNNANKTTETGGGGKNSPPDGPNGNGGKVKYRRPKKRVKCFCVQDNAKGGRDEYNRQLKKQQEGINSMSASDYLSERKVYTGKDPCDGYKPTDTGATKFRNPSVTKDAKKRRLKELATKYTDELRQKDLSRNDAKRLGKAKAKQEISMQDALHNQDMVAGGQDVIGSLSADGSRTLGDDDFGFSGTNRHIGSQWNGDRIRSIDIEACQMNKAGLGDEKLNVELRPCGKHESANCKQKRKGK
jgi:hypothetical protein